MRIWTARRFLLSALLLSLPVLSGCWSQFELPQLGFVMGVALDEGEDGNIEMTSQIYRPTPSGTSQGKSRTGSMYVNIVTKDLSVEEAIRDIPIHLGRKAQWSHMRMILISDRIAAHRNIGELLDMYYRDHEPRLTAAVAVTRGKAGEYLDKHPLVEQTTSQQLLRVMETSYHDSGKTVESNLLYMAEQMLSGNGDAALPYLYATQGKDTFSTAGVALIKNGRMIGILDSKHTEGLLMLRNKYQSGMQNLPCSGQPNRSESVEILKFSSRLKVHLSERPRLQMDAYATLAIGELKCTTIQNNQDEQKFIRRLRQSLTDEIMATYDQLQREKTDIIGVGQRVYAVQPALWRKWKPDWEKRFSEIPLQIRLRLKIVTTGTSEGRPAVTGKGSE
ncbi:Ger(x)C family spore germination protein [Cohnella zeiphila]|uniref:Ger(X)C family spore germination protein n=1 Tax=Cohnella zeiphila TaxID=2761120 RepID=A0A7X0SS84_9BACL|nr:Ger(x)C family spore germination protein [Cohnella zeiphila]MBB6735197.1 Ger(x)C family spore germination protein [Cohnella zeiphila]